MDNNMKNIIILKNLPSNLVDEAIVILKNNKKVKRLEHIEDKIKEKSNAKEIVQNKNDDFFVKEAENVISDYISKIEKQDIKGIKKYDNLEKKYKKIKFLTIFLILLSSVMIILNLF